MHGNGAVFFPVLGRILLGIFFVFLAVHHAMHWRLRADKMRERHIVMPTLVLWVGIILYFIGGLFLIFKLIIGITVIVLSITVLIRAFVMGNFWSKKGDEQHLASLYFMTNIALLGALWMAL